MDIIDKKRLFDKKKEMYVFIEQFGIDYINSVICTLWKDIKRNSSFYYLENKIYTPDSYLKQAKTEEELSFYHLLNIMNVMEWNSILDLSPIILQIFSKFKILYKNYDPYLEMYKILKSNGFLNSNCCEIGAGIYPRLSELVNTYLKQNNHKLVIYEPNIILDHLQNITIIKDKFSKQVDLSDIDTLFGLFPCSATVPLLEKAFEENKNLVLAFCACDHSTKEYEKKHEKYWCETVCALFKEKYSNVEIINWNDNFNLDLPIMIKKKTSNKKA